MKAYLVTDKKYERATFWCYVLAGNASKAKYQALCYDESCTIQDERLFPVELTVHRMPVLDGNGITMADLMNADQLGWTECEGCDKEIWEFPAVENGGHIYCSESCLAEHPRKSRQPVNGICLYVL